MSEHWEGRAEWGAMLVATWLGLAGVAALAAEPAASQPGPRVLWTTSRVVGSPEPPPPYQLVRTFESLKFDQPLYVAFEPGTDRVLVCERGGKVFVFPNRQDVQQPELLLDAQLELYAICFHPQFLENGFVYSFGNLGKDKDHRDRVTRYQLTTEEPRRVVPDSGLVILEWETNGHNGGDVAFGPDGFLYVSTGDSTTGSDPKETGQDLSDLLATMLRLDVDHPSPGQNYSVPADNPFVGVAGARPEIWAYGLRNPWRFSFDRQTGDLWLGDVGQDLWEMIYLIQRAGNYGWSVYEGGHPFILERKLGPTPHLPPTVEHPHSEFRSIVGGVMYDGGLFPELARTYLYGDHETGRIWGFRYRDSHVLDHRELARTSVKLASFAVDFAGNVLVTDVLGGELFRLEHAPPESPGPPFPTRLSETGIFASLDEPAPAPGLIPYTVNSPLWSDGAHKERWLGVPGDGQIEFRDTLAWQFPEGTVLVKTFSLDKVAGDPTTRQRVETRLLTLQRGHWQGYSYAWNEEQTDAELVASGGLDRTLEIEDPGVPGGLRRQTWHYPSRAECMVCHTRAASYVLGVTTPQMNRAAQDQPGENQISRLGALGLFKNQPALQPETYAVLADPADATRTLEERARSYLHSNCSHCHVEDGGGNARMQLGHATRREEMGLIGVKAQHALLGIPDALLVAPGSPERSLLYQRIVKTGPGRMPPLASSVVDQQAAALFRDWILQLPAEPEPPDAKPE